MKLHPVSITLTGAVVDPDALRRALDAIRVMLREVPGCRVEQVTVTDLDGQAARIGQRHVPGQ